MRIIVEEEKNIWTIQEIGDFEWYLLSRLPDTADPGNSAKGKKRLLPDAVDPEEDPEAASDWREFVRPEMEDRFASNVAIVSNALDAAEQEDTAEGKSYRMELPLDDVEVWYLVLNQARLMLNEESDVATLQERLEKEGVESIEEGMTLPIAQYEFYTAIQSYLIARIMDHG